MSNGKSSALKRAVDTAFGEENTRKSKSSRRKLAKASRPQYESTLEAQPTQSKTYNSNSPAEPPKALQLPNPPQTQPPHTAETNGTEILASRIQPARGNLEKKSRKKQRAIASDWTISTAEGGRFLKLDPVLLQEDS
jgi:hypothetical protein